ncbi:uncharacterized protein LOC136041665 [Artemia franciscana]|uniref:uncharacterized protein LOC136041665 n=1 Tax=Artemia franciscana TaxID=6661 RepID=UPI0032DBA049
MNIIRSANRLTKFLIPKAYASSSTASKTATSTVVLPKETIKKEEKPVGPGASKSGQYKNSEFYTYNPMSYYDIEAEMSSFRLPRVSSK